MSRTKKDKPVKFRNWQAVNAQFRNSAGAIPDQKKEDARTACRKAIEEEEGGPEPSPICKVWGTCHHPELCKDKCWDEDLNLKVDPFELPTCQHVWGIDGAHSNEYCKKCFISKEKE